ncbi:MAG: anaerobic ribonucleoside-triphosphate reductase activating protein [archaeon]
MQTIGGFQRSTLVDYPGKVACTVFFNGCNFRCGFCHNPFLIFNSEEAITGEGVLSFLDTRKGLLDAVVLSGGEPCRSAEIISFAKKIKEKGFLVKLDTNGYYPDILESMLPYLDYVAMDIKGSLKNYKRIVGCELDIERIKRSAKMVNGEFRTTVVPGLFDVSQMREIGEWLKGSKKFCIQNFVSRDEHIDSKYKGLHGFTEKELEEFRVVASEYFEEVEIRNL